MPLTEVLIWPGLILLAAARGRVLSPRPNLDEMTGKQLAVYFPGYVPLAAQQARRGRKEAGMTERPALTASTGRLPRPASVHERARRELLGQFRRARVLLA